jgi:hypothetical protein
LFFDLRVLIEKVFDPLQQLVYVRLRDESICLCLASIPLVGFVNGPRVDDDRRIVVELSHLTAQPDAVSVREPDVEDEEIEGLSLSQGQTHSSIFGRDDVVALAL